MFKIDHNVFRRTEGEDEVDGGCSNDVDYIDLDDGGNYDLYSGVQDYIRVQIRNGQSYLPIIYILCMHL